MTKDAKISEKRRHPRVNTPHSTVNYQLLNVAKVIGEKGKPECKLNNISMGGVSLTVEENVRTETPIDLEIKLKELVDIIKSYGKVVWTRKNRPNVYELGVVFSWWTKEEDKSRIAEFIERKLL
ncbi:MAG: PilZ domain-containing protein [Candidatus Omnitrophota bacterium]